MAKKKLKTGKTFRQYYESIEIPIDPRTAFLNEIAKMTGKTFSACKKWAYELNEPSSDMECQAIENITGYAKESLFPKRYGKVHDNSGVRG